jgi:hypothetical protein
MEFLQEQQSNMNLINRTFFTIPILLFLIMVLSFFLYRNLTKKVQSTDNPKIGVLTFKTRTIQRKYDNEVIWESISTTTEIHNKDTIRTEELSDAVLTLEDGTKIQIGENSMILVDFSNNNWNLNFAYGTVAANREDGKTDSVMNIQSGDTKIVVGGGGLTLDKAGENLNVKVDSGQAKITSGNKEQQINSDQVASLSKDGMKVSTSNYKLTSPEDRSIKVILTGKEKIIFSWASLGKLNNNSVNFELATDSGFRRVVFNQKINSNTLSHSLQPGSYYWRLSYKDDTGAQQFTGISRFSLVQKENLKIFSPNKGQIFTHLPGIESAPINFSWSKAEVVSSYNIQISKNEDFSNIFLQKETLNNSISFSDLPEGDFYTRVIGKSSIEGISELVSGINNFSINSRSDLEKPLLYEPSNGKSVSKLTIPESGLFFSWKDSSDFENYQFILADNSNFSNPIIDKIVDSNFQKVTNELTSEKYYWKIIGNSKSGNKKESETFQFQVSESVNLVLLRPVNGSKIDLTDDSKVILSWKPFPNIGTASIEISKSLKWDQAIKREKITSSSYTFNVETPGIYYWRLIWEGGKDNIYSEPFSFVASKKLSPPKLLSPIRNQTVDMTVKDSLNFQWSNVEDIDLYHLIVYDVAGIKEREVINIKVKEAKFQLTDLTKLNQGKFRWEVKSLLKNTDGSFSESVPERADFYISLSSGLTTKILTPEKVYVE